jgi:hypothetical protein
MVRVATVSIQLVWLTEMHNRARLWDMILVMHWKMRIAMHMANDNAHEKALNTAPKE